MAFQISEYWIYLFSILPFIYCIAKYIPTLIHRIQNLGVLRSSVSKIAHRGSRLEGLPENTKASFKDAIKAGADVIELDVWQSTDKKVVVFHDASFKRMTDSTVLESPSSIHFNDFPKLNPPENQRNRIADYPVHEWSTVPLLEEILALTPENVCMIIEFKQDSDELIAEVLRLLKESGRTTKTFWFSLKESINIKLRKANKLIPTICSEIGMLKILVLHYLGILPFVSVNDAVFGITTEEISLERIKSNETLKNVSPWLHKVLAFLFSGKPPSIMICPSLFSHLRARGIPVWFLGVNSTEDLELALKSGATGVLTDRPAWLLSEMEKNKWKFKKVTIAE